MDTSVNSICALEWVSKPSLYRDFGSEDGLTAAVLQRYAEVVLARMDDLLASPVSFAAKCEAMIQFASADPSDGNLWSAKSPSEPARAGR